MSPIATSRIRASLTARWVHRTLRRVLPIAALFACSAPPSADAPAADGTPAADERAILAAVDAYYTAFSARDWTAFADAFWPDATITTVWQPPGEPAPGIHVSTIDAFIAQAAEGPGSREIFEERMTGSRVLQHGSLALVWADYDARFGDPGDIMEWSGVDAITLLRLADRWRIVSIAFASDG